MRNRWIVALVMMVAMGAAPAAARAQAPHGAGHPAPPAAAHGDEAGDEALDDLAEDAGDWLAWGGDGPAAMGAAAHRGPGHGRHGMIRLHGRMVEALGLSDAQRDRIRDIREAQMRRAVQQRADLQLARMDLHQLMRRERPDRAAVETQVDKLARLQAELHKGRAGAHLDMLAVLTPEQRGRMRELHDGRMGQRLRQRLGPDGARPPGGPRAPRGGTF
jgi:Spy/CpxP family protein refolding chaperone